MYSGTSTCTLHVIQPIKPNACPFWSPLASFQQLERPSGTLFVIFYVIDSEANCYDARIQHSELDPIIIHLTPLSNNYVTNIKASNTHQTKFFYSFQTKDMLDDIKKCFTSIKTVSFNRHGEGKGAQYHLTS